MPHRSERYTNTLQQTAVYWASPVADGYGGRTFDDPVEIACRWEYRQELFIDAHGRERRSEAVIYVNTDLDLGGYLYLGDLDDLDSGEEADPTTVTNAREVRRFDKVPALRSSTSFTYKAWL